MNFTNLLELYEKEKKTYGVETYRHISSILEKAKIIHKNDWSKSPTLGGDHEQSWRAFKGKNLEKLIMHVISDGVTSLGLKVVDGNSLERTDPQNLSKELSIVKRNVSVDYGKFGLHLPDVDIIIYEPNSFNVLAVISSKVTLRERIAQTGYWKIKLSQNNATKHIRVFFITPDEDATLTVKEPAKKGRAIVEIDTDGSYVMTEDEVQESDKVKMFDKFIDDLRQITAKRN